MTASLKTHAWELMALALFYFVFLGGEYFFDATLASFMSPADVVLNQGMILGASAVGFCCFEPFSRTPRRVRLGCSIASMVVGFGGIAVLLVQPSLLLMQVIGVICFYLLGVLGGAVHWAASRKIAGFDTCRVAGWDCLRRGNRHAVRRQRGVLGSPCSIDRPRRRRGCALCGLPPMLCERMLRRCDPGRG